MMAQLIIHGILCDEIAKKDKRIKVIHQKNSGLSAARNIGIKNANGKYIGFVDSDDVISSQMYEVMYKAILDSNSQIATCNNLHFYDEELKFDEVYKIEDLNQDEAIKELMRDKKIMNYMCNKLFNVELFKDIELPIGKKFEDVGTTFKLFLKAKNVVYLDMKLYGYYGREDSITSNYNINTSIDFVKMIKYRYDILIEEKPNLIEYIDMNRVNSSIRSFLDIAKHKKIKVLKNKEFKKILYEELALSKKLNTKKVREINTKKLNILSKILYFNPYIFCFIMKFYYK